MTEQIQVYEVTVNVHRSQINDVLTVLEEVLPNLNLTLNEYNSFNGYFTLEFYPGSLDRLKIITDTIATFAMADKLLTELANERSEPKNYFTQTFSEIGQVCPEKYFSPDEQEIEDDVDYDECEENGTYETEDTAGVIISGNNNLVYLFNPQ